MTHNKYKMKHILYLILGICAGWLTACSSNGNKTEETTEVPLFASELQKNAPQQSTEVVDSVSQGPFNKVVSFQRPDDNGGYEEYRLKMDLYKGDVPDRNGDLCYGILSLYVKTPENTEGVEVARRVITQVIAIEDASAELVMSGSEENAITFKALVTYHPEDYTYDLQMDADPAQLEDLMENSITLR